MEKEPTQDSHQRIGLGERFVGGPFMTYLFYRQVQEFTPNFVDALNRHSPLEAAFWGAGTISASIIAAGSAACTLGVDLLIDAARRKFSRV